MIRIILLLCMISYVHRDVSFRCCWSPAGEDNNSNSSIVWSVVLSSQTHPVQLSGSWRVRYYIQPELTLLQAALEPSVPLSPYITLYVNLRGALCTRID